MTNKTVKIFGTAVEFESFGKNALAYVRPVTSDDMRRRFPSVAELPEGIDLWGLFGADGKPLAVADDQATLFHDAQERNLLTVRVQ